MSDFLPPVVAKLGANITEFKTKMTEARGEMSKTEKDGGSSFSNLSKGVAIGAAGIGAAVVGMAVSSLNKFQDVAEAVDGLQDITGETAEQTSRLQYAFQSWGISSDQVQKSMKTLTKAVASGNDIFDQYGIKTKDANGNTLGMSDIVANAADVFAKMPDGIDKTNLALKLFGKSGDEMLDVMNGGSAGLKELGAEADKYGITIGQKAVDSQQKNAKATRQMHAAWEGLQIQIGQRLMPIVTKLTTWLAEHLPGAIAFVQKAINASIPVFKEIGVIIGDIVKVVQEVVGWFKDQFGPSAEGAGGKASLLGQIIGQLKTIFMDTFTIIKTIVMDVVGAVQFIWQNFGDIITGVAQGLWDSFKGIFQGIFDVVTGLFQLIKDVVTGKWGELWDDITQIVTGAWETVKGVITGAWTIIQGIFESAGRLLSDAWSRVWDGIKSALSGVWEGIKSIVSGAVNSVASTISIAWNGVKDTAASVWNGIKEFLRGVWDGITTVVTGAIESVESAIGAVWDRITRTVSTVWNGIKQTISDVVGGIKSIIGGIWDGITNGFKSAVNWVIDRLNGLIDDANLIPFVNIPHIPKLAKGGEIMTSGLAVVGERGAEVVELPKGAKVHPHGTGPTGMGESLHLTQNFYGITDVAQLARESSRATAWAMKTRAA